MFMLDWELSMTKQKKKKEWDHAAPGVARG